MDKHSGPNNRSLACRGCGTPLAHDQRYCIGCGARRGPLPAHLANLIAAMIERGQRVRAAGRLPADPQGDDPRWLDAWLRTPRAAAVAVLGMLAFGVIIGSLVTGSTASPLAQLIVEETPSSGAGAGATGNSGSPAAGTDTSVTVTSTLGAPPSSAAPAAAASPGVGRGTPSVPALNPKVPPIKHVFLVVLSSQGYNQTFAQTRSDPYLAKRLTKQGEQLVNYYAVAGSPLANEIAMVSGQGPNPDTASDCPKYNAFISSGFGAQGQQLGSGCVYPPSVQSLADQLTAAKRTWKAYLQTMPGQRKAGAEQCHPGRNSSQGSSPTPSEPYAAWRNPFMFFRSLTPTACPKLDVPLAALRRDLRRASKTPTLSYVVPDACHDGSDIPCAQGAPAGMGPADQFLSSVIPEIERSAAYRNDGLIAVTFDEAPQSGPNADSSSCCGNPAYPNMQGSGSSATGSTTTTSSTTTSSTATTTSTATGLTATLSQVLTTTSSQTTSSTTSASTTSSTTTTTSTTDSLGSGQTNPSGGGGHVGLLLISRFVKPGTLQVTDYFNHFSLLASLEQLLGLPRLGYAADPALPVFGASVWTNYGH